MLIEFFQSNHFFRWVISHLSGYKAALLLRNFKPYLTGNDRVLDIGAETGHLCRLLAEQGFKATPLE